MGESPSLLQRWSRDKRGFRSRRDLLEGREKGKTEEEEEVTEINKRSKRH